MVRSCCLLCALLLLPLLAGCQLLAVGALAAPPPTILPRYTGLDKQSVAIMVWADRGTRIDFPSLRLDLANALQRKLQAAQKDSKGKVLPGTTYPVTPASVVRFQQDYPELEGAPIAQVAPKLGASRVIYIEIQSFATRSDLSVDLYRGSAEASVRVVEVGSKEAKTAYSQDGLKAIFPTKGPREGMPNVGDAKIYLGLVDALATEIAHTFIPYEEEL